MSREALVSHAAYIAACVDAYERAATAAGRLEYGLRLADRSLRLCFAGDALAARFMPAFGSRLLPAVPATPDWTVYLWDSETSGVASPRPPWSASAYRESGEIDGFNDGRISINYESHVLNMTDREARTSVYWVERIADVPWWEDFLPLRVLLHQWTLGTPLQLVHAAAVGDERGAVLITGKNGIGKSTSALACLGSPLGIVGDDFVLVDTERALVYNLYAAVKLEVTNLDRFPSLQTHIANRDAFARQKAVVYLDQVAPHMLRDGLYVRGVCVPQVMHEQDSALVPTASSAILAALTVGTLAHLKTERTLVFARLAAFMRHVGHGYTLRAGTDLTQIPAIIGRFLDIQ